VAKEKSQKPPVKRGQRNYPVLFLLLMLVIGLALWLTDLASKGWVSKGVQNFFITLGFLWWVGLVVYVHIFHKVVL